MKTIILSFLAFFGLLFESTLSFSYTEMNNDSGISILEKSDSHNNPLYQAAIRNWPNEISIWDKLSSKKSKLIFLNYLKSIDDTNLRKYNSFENLCTGFSTQFFVRFSKFSTLKNDELARLEKVGIKNANYPKKFKIPVYMSSYYGHYFNSVLLDESSPEDFNSYLIVEPQNDLTISKESNSLLFTHYAERFPVTIDLLQKFDNNNRFITKTMYTFIHIKDGLFNMTLNKKYTLFLNFLFLAETEEMNYKAELSGRSFKEYIKYKIELFQISKSELNEIFNLVNGKLFRESKDEEQKPMTFEMFNSLIE